MAITKRLQHVITALSDGQLQVRIDTIFEEDGVELTRTHHRKVLEPTLTPLDPAEPALLKDIAGAVWTEARVTEYERIKSEREFETRILVPEPPAAPPLIASRRAASSKARHA